jgi:hypothetical protein
MVRRQLDIADSAPTRITKRTDNLFELQETAGT